MGPRADGDAAAVGGAVVVAAAGWVDWLFSFFGLLLPFFGFFGIGGKRGQKGGVLGFLGLVSRSFFFCGGVLELRIDGDGWWWSLRAGIKWIGDGRCWVSIVFFPVIIENSE